MKPQLKQIQDDLVANLTGKMDDKKLKENLEHVAKFNEDYPISGSIFSAIFYISLQLYVDEYSKKFTGDGGGAFTPGVGPLTGDLYTDDRNKLFSETISFEVNATAVYVNVNFFDGDSNLLGSAHMASVSTVTGIGGGKGAWV